MKQEQKQYILDHKEDLENNDLDKFFSYKDLPRGMLDIIYQAIPDCLEHMSYVPEWGFYKSDIKSIDIPDSVTELGIRAFYNCTSLKSITIPDSVTEIGKFAFYECTSLQSITIPDSIAAMGHGVFNRCPVTVKCKKGSYADKYSQENDLDVEYI